VGSLSPTVNWRDLRELRFRLPALERQHELAELLWAGEELKSTYRQLLFACNEQVKSRFVELFGDSTIPTVKTGEVLSEIRNGLSPARGGDYHATVLTLSAITQGAFDAEARKEDTFKNEPPIDKRVVAGDFYICRGNGNKALVGTGEYPTKDIPDLVFPDTIIAGHVDQSLMLLPFLRAAWKQDDVRRQIEAKARTTNGIYKINQAIVASIEIPLPSIELQQEFANFVSQVDKSEFALKQAIEGVSATMAAILNQELGMSDVQ
jgi:type I restriction enzyme S subunit